MDDELELKTGQLVRLLHAYDDGWAMCIKLGNCVSYRSSDRVANTLQIDLLKVLFLAHVLRQSRRSRSHLISINTLVQVHRDVP